MAFINHPPHSSTAPDMAHAPAAPTDSADGQASPITMLERASKERIVLMGLLLGVLAYALPHVASGRYAAGVWIVLASLLAAGAFMALSVVRWGDTLWWRCLGVVAAGVVLVNASVWWMSDAGRQPNTAWGVLQVALVVGLAMVLPWVQSLLQNRRWRAVRYSSLFVHAWHNAMVTVVAWQWVALCWLVLMLWAGLFSLIQLPWFTKAFTQPLFICAATGLMAGVGVALARSQPRALQVQLQLLLALFKVLLPLLAVVVVLFTVALPLTGLEPLWQTRKATVLLLVVQLCVVVCVNAVYQDGLQTQPPYPQWMRWLVQVALLVLPVLGALAVWAVVLRVQQYGWTPVRVAAMVMTVVAWLYGLGYAWVALQRSRFLWLRGLGRWNAAMSWLVIALLLVLHTPVFDIYRWSAHSQLQRLQQEAAALDVAALQSLRFDHGRHGLPALQALAQSPRASDPATQAIVQQVLQLKQKMRVPRQPATASAVEVPVREMLTMVPGHTSPPQDWWDAIDSGHLRAARNHCQQDKQQCVVLQLALQTDGVPLPVLCRLGAYLPTCSVFAREAQGAWKQVGQLEWGGVPQAKRKDLE